MAAGNYVLDDVDKEEINVTVVDPNYGSQLLEFIIDDGKNEAADVETGGDWSDVKPEEYVKIDTDLPGEKRAGISGGGGSPCLQPGATTPVNANETATPADTGGGGATTGGGGAADTPKQDESALIGKDAIPNLDASGQGSKGVYAKQSFTNVRTPEKVGWYVGPIKTKVVSIPGVNSKWTVTIEAWAIYTNLLYDIHNEIENINLYLGGEGEYSLFVREINDGNVNPGWPKPRWSNHATGTGVDLNAPYHPYYKKNNRPSDDKRHWGVAGLQKLKYLLGTKYKDAVKGGFTYYDDMHFEVVIKPSEFTQKIKQLNNEMNLDARAAAIQSGRLPLTVKYPPVIIPPRKKSKKKKK